MLDQAIFLASSGTAVSPRGAANMALALWLASESLPPMHTDAGCAVRHSAGLGVFLSLARRVAQSEQPS